MRPCHRGAPAPFILALILPCGSAAAQGTGEKVDYEILTNSVIVDSCRDCDRAPIEEEIFGQFTLVRMEKAPLDAESFRIEDLHFRCTLRVPGGMYESDGSGTYSLFGRADPRQETLTLDLTVGGVSGVHLEGGPSPEKGVWPRIELEATEDGSRDPAHVFAVRLVAAPKAKPVLYELSKDSIFIDDCRICGRPTIPIPITGTFTLTPTPPGPDPFQRFQVDAVDFKSNLEGFDYRIQGSGEYKQGGEFALLQRMDLTVAVNDETGVILSSDTVTVTVGLPEIDIQLMHQNPTSEAHVYSLHIIAKPSEGGGDPPNYRRGDANGDDTIDISDGVFVLLWRFSGGAEPACLDAADTNDDEQHDLTDAVFLFNFLFQGGSGPPAPGAETCGQPATPSLGCEASPCP